MYAHWAVLPLARPVRYYAVPQVGDRVPCSFLLSTHTWLLFSMTGQDQFGILLQLSIHSSCDLVDLRVMRRPLLLLGELFKSLTQRTGFAVKCLLSISYIIHPVYARGWGDGVHPPLSSCFLMVDDIIYWGRVPSLGERFCPIFQ